MAINRDDRDERQARLDAFIEELRVAEQRRLVKRGIARWQRAEAAQPLCVTPPSPEKVH